MSEGVLKGLPKPKTLEEASYESLREAITSGRLKPGDRISVNQTAKDLGVSRLPVIHALRRLASEGFVQLRPHKSVLVTKPTPKELKVRFLMLSALEEVALRESWPLSRETIESMEKAQATFAEALTSGKPADEADLQFHAQIWQAAEVAQLYTTVRTLWDQGAFYRLLVHRSADSKARQQRIQDHNAILAAMAMSEPDRAVEALRSHRERALGRLERMVHDETEN